MVVSNPPSPLLSLTRATATPTRVRPAQEFPLPGAMTQQDRVGMEKKMCAAFEKLKAMPEFGGGYHSLTPGHDSFIDAAQYQTLIDEHIMFKDMAADSYLAAAGIASDWPHGRGCYVSEDRAFIIWVGEEDHLRIMCMKKATVSAAAGHSQSGGWGVGGGGHTQVGGHTHPARRCP